MGSFHPEDPPALKFANQMGEQLFPIFSDSTVPILGVNDAAIDDRGEVILVTDNRIVSQRGTGTLFRVEDAHFLVTAAHVFQTIESFQESPSVRFDNPAAPMPLEGHLHMTDELLDLAVLGLDAAVVAGLSSRRFLSLSDVEFRKDLGEGWYFIHGYPFVTSYTSKDLLTTLQTDFTYRTGVYGGSTAGFRNYDPRRHLLLASGGECRFADDVSPAEMPPSLGGISGCSMWLGFSERHYMDEWTPNMAKVVGVQTKVYLERKVIQGTRWAGVAAVIWMNYPRLHKALESHVPKELIEQFSFLPEVQEQ